MKRCVICGGAIINGQNGCAMYDTCFECKPIKYIAKPKQGCISGDYEGLILAKQEND